MLKVAPALRVLPSPTKPTSKGLSSVVSSSPASASSGVVSIPGVGFLVSKCAYSETPSGILVSVTPIGNLPVPNTTSIN